MLDLIKQSLSGQYSAAFTTLKHCIDLGGEANWQLKIGSYELGRSLFHALIFSDLYLDESENQFRKQSFHLKHAEIFEDYAELKDVLPGPSPDRDKTQLYLQHCHQKAQRVVAAETQSSLATEAPFRWTPFSRAELHVYNIRHLQHHAAQISLRLRAISEIEIPWVKTA